MRVVTSVIFCLSVFFVFSQGNFHTYGGGVNEEGGAVLLADTGGYYYVGGSRNDSALIMRMNPLNEVVWSKSYKFGTGPNIISSLVFTANGDLVGTGSRTSGIVSEEYGFVIRISQSGVPVWQSRVKYTNHHTRARDAVELNNGNILCLFSGGPSFNTSVSTLMELEGNTGSTLWDTSYFKTSLFNGKHEIWTNLEIEQASDEIYLSGTFQIGGSPNSSLPVVSKLDSNGKLLWTRVTQYPIGSIVANLGGPDMLIDGDSLIMLLNGKDLSMSSVFDVGIQKLDASGIPTWNRWYTSSGAFNIRAKSIIAAPNGYLIGGYVQAQNVSQNQDIFLIRMSENGDVIWSKKYGTSSNENFEIETSHSPFFIDGNNIKMTGWTDGVSGNKDLLVLDVNLNDGALNGGCSDDLSLTEISLPNYSELYALTDTSGLYDQFSIASNSANVSITSGAMMNLQTDLPVINDTISLCDGSVDILADWNPSYNYQWSNGASSQQVTISQAGTYIVNVSYQCVQFSDTIYAIGSNIMVDLGQDTVLCALSDSLMWDFTGVPGTFLWSDGDTSPNNSVSSEGVFWLEINHDGCIDRDSISLDYVVLPEQNLGVDTVLCMPDNLVLYAPGNTGDIIWQDGSSEDSLIVNSTGDYWVVVDSLGCVEIDTINVSFVPAPPLDLGNDTVVCGLVATVSLDAGVAWNSYEWQDGSLNSTYDVDTAGLFWVSVSNGICSAVDSIEVSYQPLPVSDLGADTIVCGPFLAVLDAGCMGCSYLWQDGNQAPSIDVSFPGLYSVEVDLNGCSITDSILIKRLNVPNLTINDFELCSGRQTLLSMDDDEIEYDWSDGSSGSDFLVESAGEYAVIASNYCGSDTTGFKVYSVDCDCNVYLPNTFTPNNDFVNGVFRGHTHCGLQFYELSIFDRWGRLVFFTNDLQSGWDGTTAGSTAPDGTYTWNLKYAFVDSVPAEIQGHVNLLR